jgi:hypothetical protein
MTVFALTYPCQDASSKPVCVAPSTQYCHLTPHMCFPEHDMRSWLDESNLKKKRPPVTLGQNSEQRHAPMLDISHSCAKMEIPSQHASVSYYPFAALHTARSHDERSEWKQVQRKGGAFFRVSRGASQEAGRYHCTAEGLRCQDHRCESLPPRPTRPYGTPRFVLHQKKPSLFQTGNNTDRFQARVPWLRVAHKNIFHKFLFVCLADAFHFSGSKMVISHMCVSVCGARTFLRTLHAPFLPA